MKVMLATLRAISWPASGSGPKVPMRYVTAPKIDISTNICAPTGAPKRVSSRRRLYSMSARDGAQAVGVFLVEVEDGEEEEEREVETGESG